MWQNRFRTLDFDSDANNPFNPIEVVEGLLQFCQERKAEFRGAISDFPMRRAKSRVRAWFRLLFNHPQATFAGLIHAPFMRVVQNFLGRDLEDFAARPPVDIPEPLLAVLDSIRPTSSGGHAWPSSIPQVVKARAIAMAIDDALAHHFVRAFTSYHGRSGAVVRLQAGMAFPCRLEGLCFPGHIYRVATSDDLVDSLANLRLFPGGVPLNVEMLSGGAYENVVESVLTQQEALRIGVACLGPVAFRDLDRFYQVHDSPGQTHEYHQKECPPEERRIAGMRAFFPVEPTERFVDSAAMIDLLRRADDGGVKILVFPELAMSRSQLLALRDAFFQQPLKNVNMLVAGSVHITDETGARRNRLYVFFRDEVGGLPSIYPPEVGEGYGIVHDKIGTFSFRRSDSENRVSYHYENIQRSQTLRVLLSAHAADLYQHHREGGGGHAARTYPDYADHGPATAHRHADARRGSRHPLGRGLAALPVTGDESRDRHRGAAPSGVTRSPRPRTRRLPRWAVPWVRGTTGVRYSCCSPRRPGGSASSAVPRCRSLPPCWHGRAAGRQYTVPDRLRRDRRGVGRRDGDHGGRRASARACCSAAARRPGRDQGHRGVPAPIPSVALIPLVSLLLGPGLRMSATLIVYGAIWPVLYNTIAGINDVEPLAKETNRVFGFSRLATIRMVSLPSAAPFIATGIRLASAVAIILGHRGRVHHRPDQRAGHRRVHRPGEHRRERPHGHPGGDGLGGHPRPRPRPAADLGAQRRLLRWHRTYLGRDGMR